MEVMEDGLYEQALLSLKQLNQDVFLNDLEAKLNKTIIEIQQEAYGIQKKIGDDQSYLSATIENLKKVVNLESEKSIQSVTTLDGQVRMYFREFYSHLTQELQQLKGSVHESALSSQQLIKSYAVENESRFQIMQERVGSIESLYAHWLAVSNEVKADMSEKAIEIGQANDEQRILLETVRIETRTQLSELERVMHMIEHDHTTVREATKEELLKLIEDLRLSYDELNQSRLAWEKARQDELILRIDSEATLRQQLLKDITAAQQVSTEITTQQLKEENAILMTQYNIRDKQNRLFLIGLVILGGVQIIFNFV